MANDSIPNDPNPGGEGPEGGLMLVDIEQELRRSYLGYAVSTLVSRALPDIRDGFKPVQRRILYAMRELGVGPGSARVKSAKVVGETMGTYHPHGDSSIYGTMVRMAQDFSLRYPLVDGQGNFGCFTGDTKIKLLDGTEKTFAELAELSPEEVFYVYSVDKNGRIVVGEGRHSRITRRKARLVEVTLDTGAKVRCTPDHRFMLRDGTYKQARHLTPQDSLMPGYFDTTPVKEGLNAYLRIQQPATGEYEFVHQIADRYNAEKGLACPFNGPFVRHHKNFNRWDNRPTNIERMDFLAHLNLHSAHLKTLWEDEVFREAQRQGILRYYETHPEVLEARKQERSVQNRDPEFRRVNGARVAKSLKHRYAADEAARAEISARMRTLWSDPEYRAKMSEALTNLEKRPLSPEDKERIACITSERSRAMWSDDAKRAVLIEAITAAMASEEIRAKISAAVKNSWQTPEYREHYSEDHFSRIAHILWADPSTREMHREKIERQWQDEGFREAQRGGVRRSNARRLNANPTMMTELAEKAAAALTEKWSDPSYKHQVMRRRVARYASQLLATNQRENITPGVYESQRTANWIPRLDKALTYFKDFEELLESGQRYNHKITAVKFLEVSEDVYDITVNDHHNFLLECGVFVHNSIDADPPAAMRYTECRLTPLAMELMDDIDKDTVDWMPNYDQSKREPRVLPGKFPNFICNGGEGIAVGMSTSVPPHNLREVVEACIYLLDHPEASAEDLYKFIPGPDFPTAGSILGTKGAKEAYRTGRGRVVMQAQFQIEPMDNGKNAIVVTELPYQVVKARLIEHIADLVKHKKVDGITDINDYSDKHGMRIVIELRRDVLPKRIVNFLLKHTALRQTFGIILLALVNGQPRLLNLPQVLNLFLAHRKDVIVRRTRYELGRAKAAAHIREGLQIALNFLDEIIALIRRSPSSEVARTEMCARFGLTQIQAEAILNMQLRQISQLERQKIEDEYKRLLKEIAFYEDILVTPAKVVKIVKDELRGLRDKYGDERRTRIVPVEADDITEDDLIPEEKTLVTISRDGYIKRVPIDTYRTQKRGGRGVQAANLKEEDQLAHLFVATTTHYILFFTNRGRVYRLKAYEVPATSRQARGQHINNFIQVEPGDKITAILPMKDMNAPGFLLLATANGEVKRTALAEFANLRVNGKKCFDIEEGDSLDWVKHTDGSQEVMMITRNGMSIRFKESDVPERGYTAGGVRGMELRDPKSKQLVDRVVAMDVVSPTSQLLVCSEKGFGKRTDLASYRAQSRGGKGIITMNVTPKTGPIVDAAVVEPADKLMVLTEKGVNIRMEIATIRSTGRSTQGVTLIKVGEGDKVATIERLISTEEVEAEANAEAEKQNGSNGK